MNVFRILADVSHTASKCILIWAIHKNRSAEGVSLLTQWLYMMVFCTRYLDLFWVPPWWSWWNTFLKLLYIATSAYIVWIMMRVFARTREKEYAWKLATWSLGASAVFAPVVCLIFRGWDASTLVEVSSPVLEHVRNAQLTDVMNRFSGLSARFSKAFACCRNYCSSARQPSLP